MSTPVTPMDTGNPILSEVPATFSCTPVNGPGGQRLAFTVRTGSTTLTIFLAKDHAINWRDVMSEAIGQMSGLIVPTSANGNGSV